MNAVRNACEYVDKARQAGGIRPAGPKGQQGSAMDIENDSNTQAQRDPKLTSLNQPVMYL